ncbi:uncharacterized protein LOC106093663 [Stomoxys calcitrans]|uniref:uncharacterized protein LOC106093663 n=1 Tax=Stomoxys calcitrans TaxID=35570 RepID=UPI0027E2E5B3|nr:uncharacterized protein LOC106093663 [Stomoxys calcitrans]
MTTRTLANISIICFLSGYSILHVESASINASPDNVVYRLFHRRRPGLNYEGVEVEVDEYLEIFNTRKRPWDILTDDDVDKFIKCDFYGETEECTQFLSSIYPNESGTHGKPITTTKKKTITATTPSKAINTIHTTTTPSTSSTTTMEPIPDPDWNSYIEGDGEEVGDEEEEENYISEENGEDIELAEHEEKENVNNQKEKPFFFF